MYTYAYDDCVCVFERERKRERYLVTYEHTHTGDNDVYVERYMSNGVTYTFIENLSMNKYWARVAQ